MQAEIDAAIMRESAYRIGSMTKPTIAVAMLLLYEEGKWQLDDPVTKFIPEFTDLKLSKDGQLVPLDRPMTMRHLMASSAGFAFGPAFGSSNPKVDEMYVKADLWSGANDGITPKLAKLPLEAQPGTEFRYGLQQEVQGAILRRKQSSGKQKGDPDCGEAAHGPSDIPASLRSPKPDQTAVERVTSRRLWG
jgi:hypothetical protein